MRLPRLSLRRASSWARAALALSGALVPLAFGGRALAASTDHPRVALTIDPCVEVDAVEVRRIVAVELDAQLADEGAADTTKTRATCEGLFVRLEVIDPITGKSLSRTVRPGDEPGAARPRLLAIAIAELVSASWTELAFNPQPVVAAATRPPSPEAKAAALRTVRERASSPPPVATHAGGGVRSVAQTLLPAPHVSFGVEQGHGPGGPPAGAGAPEPPSAAPPGPASERATRVEVLFELRALPAPSVTSVGFGAAVSRSWRRPLAGGIDLQADHGQASTPLGTVSIDTLSVGPSAFLEATRGRFRVRGGVGVRVGVADLAGHAASPGAVQSHAFFSPWGGPFASVAGYAELARGIALTVGGEAGDIPFPVHARILEGTTETDVPIVGAFLGARAGIAASF